jgi:predicted metal-binding protein
MADQDRTHRLVACTDCPQTKAPCAPGLALVQKLNAALLQSGDALPEDFEFNGTVFAPDCARACTLGFCARAEGASVFGEAGAFIATALHAGALQ